MHDTITYDRAISINDAGITTIQYEVTHDQDRSVRLTFEEYLPNAVDPSTIAVDRDRGKWAVYDDGTVQWSVSVREGETATGELGVVCTTPETVRALVEESASRVLAGEPAAPPDSSDEIGTIEPNGLATATATERVPESVYEAVREHRDGADADSTGTAMPLRSTEPSTTATDSNEPTSNGPASTTATDSNEPNPTAPGSNDPPHNDDGSKDSPERTSSRDAPPATGSRANAVGWDMQDVDADQIEGGTSTGDHEPTETPSRRDTSGGDDWNGDPLENALRVKDQHSRANENAYRFVLAFDEDDANATAIEVLTGLLNGTTVFGANPTLPDLEAGADPETLTVTISSALDERAIVAALEDIDHATIDHFETLDVDLSGSNPLDTNADQQFRILDETIEQTGYDSIADDVDAIDTGEFDFGNEPVSYDDLIEDADAASATADAATVNVDEPAGETASTPSDSADDAGSETPDSAESETTGSTSVADDADRGDAETNADAHDGSTSSDRVTARLLDELEAGGVTERERVELRRRLGVDPRTSTELRLDHLHSRVDELVAYTDALEAFLDEEGTAQRILESLSESVSALETRMNDLEDQLDSRTRDLEAELESRIDDLEDRLESRTAGLEDRLDTAANEAAVERESIEERLESLASDQASDRERVSGIADAVSSNNDDIDHLASHVKSQVETLETTVDDTARTLSTLDDRVTDVEDTLTDVEDTLADVERTVEQNARVRERLESLTN